MYPVVIPGPDLRTLDLRCSRNFGLLVKEYTEKMSVLCILN